MHTFFLIRSSCLHAQWLGGVETDWKRKLSQSQMICVQKKKIKREEHYAVYYTILIAQGVEVQKKILFRKLFSTCEKIPQFSSFSRYQGGPSTMVFGWSDIWLEILENFCTKTFRFTWKKHGKKWSSADPHCSLL